MKLTAVASSSLIISIGSNIRSLSILFQRHIEDKQRWDANNELLSLYLRFLCEVIDNLSNDDMKMNTFPFWAQLCF